MAKSNAKLRRDGGDFSIVPHVVLTSPGYRQASHTARSLLIDILMTYKGHNNGKLTATEKAMAKQGWRSPGVLSLALKELVACGLLVLTRQGGFPNKTTWYALPFLDLDQTDGLDIDPKLYQSTFRRAYMRHENFARPKRTDGKRAEPNTRRVATSDAIATRRVLDDESLDMRRVAIPA